MIPSDIDAPLENSGTTDLRGHDLRGADYSHREVRDCDFRGANLSDANFRGALIINCRFDAPATDLTGAHFDAARILNGRFEGVEGERSTWRCVNAARCNFDNANLTDADFGMDESGRRSNLFAASFKGSRLVRTAFAGAILRSVISGPQTIVESINIAGCDVSGCGFVERRARPDLRRAG